MNKNHAKPYRIKQSFRKYFLNTLVPIVFNGLVIGILVGALVWGFNYCAEQVLEFSTSIYEKVNANLAFTPLLLLGVATLACLMALALKFFPELAGSGIPYTEGVMRGQLKFKKIRMFFGTIALSFISFLAGLPLGSEGPSVQLGGLTGDVVNTAEDRFDPRAKAWQRLSVTSGASAGLAVAFNAPLTGLIFALEEGHKRFSPSILLSAASTVIFAILTSRLLGVWTGVRSDFNFYIFDVGAMEMLPLAYTWMLVILGLAVGLLAVVFSLLLSYARRLLEHLHIKRVFRLLASYLLVGLTGIFILDVIGGGASLIKKIATQKLGWEMLLLLLALKLVLIALCSTSGSTGGLFVPMLALGALIGGLLGYAFTAMGLPVAYFKVVVVISMSAFMAAVVRAPLTGIILIAEITGQLLSGFLQTAIVVTIAYFMVELLNIRPLYDELLEGTLESVNRGRIKKIVQIEETIEDGSFAAGRSVRDILWPAGCHVERIVKMNRSGEIVIRGDKDGERLIHAGDIYVIQAETYDLEQTIAELNDLTHNSNGKFDTRLLDLDD